MSYINLTTIDPTLIAKLIIYTFFTLVLNGFLCNTVEREQDYLHSEQTRQSPRKKSARSVGNRELTVQR